MYWRIRGDNGSGLHWPNRIGIVKRFNELQCEEEEVDELAGMSDTMADFSLYSSR